MSIQDHSQPELFPDIEHRPHFPADVCESRHLQNPASVAANPSEEYKREIFLKIHAFVSLRGKSWLHEICREFDMKPNEVSPRISDMLAMNPPMLERLKERSEGCGMVRAL